MIGPRWQITTYVPVDEEAEFRVYARSLGIDASSLLVILTLRAGRVGPSEQEIEETARRAPSGPAKITAHFADEAVYAKAGKVIENAPGGLSQSRFCGVLIRLELERRWLSGELGVDSR